ncbi:MAG: aminomethyl-transferring glycine dehydrogenase subunit GcvPB [Deltaproteobacteria bacterium]|nr:aminomethyl-transferring glycine dehydrogenase subunit GcvPB [Deltaproteobacteria bacterium]
MKTARTVTGIRFAEPLIFDRSRPGRRACSLGAVPGDCDDLPAHLLRASPPALPELSEPEVVRHYVRLSQHNFAVDHGMYPLGSCTMKYNPKINEATARFPGFTRGHPYHPASWSQGSLALIWELERGLAEIAGMDAVTLQPAAGAHGEYAGLRVIRASLEARGERRRFVLIPDSAHGTNPASVTLNGWEVRPVASGPDGFVRAGDVEAAMDGDVAAFMMTNPNTVGLFERECDCIARIVHERGGFMYCDGANLNSLMGWARPGDMGYDVIQFNLHKTFSTPHGGGGPGSGPVGVKAALEPFLPVPRVVRGEGGFRLEEDRPLSIGRVRAFLGNFGVMVRAYTYLREMGGEGLRDATARAVVNANYLLARLRDHYHVPYPGRCMHECVVSDQDLHRHGVTNVDIAKGLIDRGFHPPTVSFPIHVHGSLMIEPTETEAPETLDDFADAMIELARLAATEPAALKDAPLKTPLSRMDETAAARNPILNEDW